MQRNKVTAGQSINFTFNKFTEFGWIGHFFVNNSLGQFIEETSDDSTDCEDKSRINCDNTEIS